MSSGFRGLHAGGHTEVSYGQDEQKAPHLQIFAALLLPTESSSAPGLQSLVELLGV